MLDTVVQQYNKVCTSEDLVALEKYHLANGTLPAKYHFEKDGCTLKQEITSNELLADEGELDLNGGSIVDFEQVHNKRGPQIT